MRILLILAFASCMIGCQQAGQSNAQNTAKPAGNTATPKEASPQSAAVSPSPITPAPANTTPSSNSAASPESEAKYFEGKGKVTEINLEQAWVGLDHEEIKGLMPPMIMQFFVKDKKMLDGLKVGDQVNFTVEEKGRSEIIVKISK